MKIYHFKKQKTPGGWELNPDDIFSVLHEGTVDFEKWYLFIANFIELSNWYNMRRTSPMNGDVQYAHLFGWICGFEAAMKIEEVDDGEKIILYKNNRKFLSFDKIPLSQTERENRIDCAKTMKALLSY